MREVDKSVRSAAYRLLNLQKIIERAVAQRVLVCGGSN
jgi:hypothetical protein